MTKSWMLLCVSALFLIPATTMAAPVGVGATATVTGTASCGPGNCSWDYTGHHGGFAAGYGELYVAGSFEDDCEWPDTGNGDVVGCKTGWSDSAPHFFGNACLFKVEAVTTTDVGSADHEICVIG